MMDATRGRPCTLVLPELRSTEDGRTLARGEATVSLDLGELRWDDEARTAHMDASVRVKHVRYYIEDCRTDGEVQAVAMVEERLAALLDGAPS